MKTKILSAVLGLGLMISSCTSELLTNDSTNTDITSLTVPTSFDWKTTREINFSVKVSDIRFKDAIHVISIYNDDPATGVAALSKGAASTSSPFTSKISIASKVKTVYIVKTAPDGTKVTQKVTLDTNPQISVSIGATSSGRIASFGTSEYITAAVLEDSPDCSSGCDFTVNEKTSDKNITLDSKTVCLTGSNYSVNVNTNNLNGGTLRICGTGITVNNMNLQNNAKFNVVITSSGSATFNNMNWDSPNVTFKNFGTVTFPNNLIVGGTLTNYGTINANSELQTRKGSTIVNEKVIIVKGSSPLDGAMTNNGEITFNGEVRLNSSGQTITNNSKMIANGNFIVNSSTTLTNNGYMTANSMQINSSGTVNNKCQLIIKTDLGVDQTLNNNSYVYVGGFTRLNSSGTVNLFNGAFFTTNTSSYDGKITGSGSDYSLFKVRSSVQNINNGNPYKLTGTVQLSEPSGKLDAKFIDKDAKYTTDGGIYIAKTECNEGNGDAPVTAKDSDKDGIIDSEDNYPNDGSKAFDNYSTPSTVAFEDQWPNLGDYDMNDVVLAYKYQIVTNAKNNVAQVIAKYTLQAAGGAYENGAGVQFELPSGSIKNFSSSTGSEVEGGQKKVVVILFKNSVKELGAWNTIPAQGVVASKSYSFSFDVVDGPSISTFGIGSYNPFIWNNSANFGRGYETHLMGKEPTDLMNTKLFGTAYDNSTGTNYYRTSGNLPWGIEIATDNFKYPSENKMITAAYWYFATWATSGGAYRTDWYSNTEAGYRYTPYIFNP
ncbi:LruC domain-containing protein [Arcicella rigui]|uniref:LruC domain-containing protein n=1 Tax=Arcicella rigui TaxID=797020 RepID=A0ABU5Q692_9BACT|nr:LruC domain-containing protein [Arcicella rigui]MEA5138118.1 LruC domain-containing protein [Arcicella rigui]